MELSSTSVTHTIQIWIYVVLINTEARPAEGRAAAADQSLLLRSFDRLLDLFGKVSI